MAVGLSSPDVQTSQSNERIQTSSDMRRQIALQRRNNSRYGGNNQLTTALEIHATQPELLILHVRAGPDGDLTVKKISSREDQQRILEAYCNDKIFAQVQSDSRNPSTPRKQQPSGGHGLEKKVGHAANSPAETSFISAKERIASLRSNNANGNISFYDNLQSLAEEYIFDIMHNPDMIIIHNGSVEIIDRRGCGLKIVNIDSESYRRDESQNIFKGFIDSLHYCQGDRKPIVSE